MKNKDSWDISFNTLKMPLTLLAIFLGIGIWRGIAAHIFYLYNFGYIGLAVAVGGFLNGAAPRKYKQWGAGFRRFSSPRICWVFLVLRSGRICRSRAFPFI